VTERQSVKLLPDLFQHIEDEQRITVLHLGSVMPETLEFLSGYRCKIYVCDVFAELPFAVDPAQEQSVEQRLATVLDLPPEARFDLCLFWDLFNYLQPEAISALTRLLRPHWHQHSRGYALGVHNTRSPQRDASFALAGADVLALRQRREGLAGYAPLPQSRLKELMQGIEVQRSVLLGDGRLELLLAATQSPSRS
jgi:hypothetical protein